MKADDSSTSNGTVASDGDGEPAAATAGEPLLQAPASWFSRLRERVPIVRGWRRSGSEVSTSRPFELPHVPAEAQRSATQYCIVLGNCQARALATALQAQCATVVFIPAELPSAAAQQFKQRNKGLLETLSEYDSILVQWDHLPQVVESFPELQPKVVSYPFILFAAYHPDLVYIDGGRFHGPMGQYNSAIALWGYLRGLSVLETIKLFNNHAYEVLGYHDFWPSSRQHLLSTSFMAKLPLREHIERWSRNGCFMHSVNHPKIHVFADLAQDLLAKLGLPCVPEGAPYATDVFADGPVWPVYPEIGDRLGVSGSYLFKIEKGRCAPERSVAMLDLREFIEGSFDAFGEYDRRELHCERLESGHLDVLASLTPPRTRAQGTAAPTESKQRNTPYSGLPAHQFWKSAVATVPWREVDPVVDAPFQIAKGTRVATAGSCFAQNISTALQRFSFNYFVTERGDDLALEEAQRRLFGIYSARYGNVYTARQLLQLFERAYGRFHPTDTAWERPDGRLVDPFRPLVEPDGFASTASVEASRSAHLDKVRELFEQLEVFVFTLGLTEAWISKVDGAVFPVAPGVIAGAADFSRYEFVNFQAADVVRDLQRFLSLLREVNSDARTILTVSPVPLVATYEPQHALVATTYSKSVLRAAAGEICARNDHCVYFPSYEIITGNYSRGAYYDADLRTVTPTGIDHVMRLFFKHYANAPGDEPVHPLLIKELQGISKIICDEQAIQP